MENKIPKILYEDSHIIVCKKPAGIPTQTKRIGTHDLVSLLKNHLAASAPSGKAPYLAVIHRLTSLCPESWYLPKLPPRLKR